MRWSIRVQCSSIVSSTQVVCVMKCVQQQCSQWVYYACGAVFQPEGCLFSNPPLGGATQGSALWNNNGVHSPSPPFKSAMKVPPTCMLSYFMFLYLHVSIGKLRHQWQSDASSWDIGLTVSIVANTKATNTCSCLVYLEISVISMQQNHEAEQNEQSLVLMQYVLWCLLILLKCLNVYVVCI